MRNFRERYWRYSLFVLILGLGITICIELTPFLGGLLGALTIYILVRKQMFSLTEKRHIRRGLAAAGGAVLPPRCCWPRRCSVFWSPSA